MVNRILVGTDFSPQSRLAVDAAATFAMARKAELVLAHFAPGFERAGLPWAPEQLAAEWERAVGEALAEDRRQLAERIERLEGIGITARSEARSGDPVTGLCRLAEELDADLVVTGTHGRTGLRRAFLGSVAEAVVRECCCNVLVARGEFDASRPHRILVATDFSDLSRQALRVAAGLAGVGGQLELLHCWYVPAVLGIDYLPATLGAQPMADTRRAVEREIERVGSDLVSGLEEEEVEIGFQAREAPPVEGIHDHLEEAEQAGRPFDLVVLGGRRHGAVERLVLGSVAEHVVRTATTSVLVVHQRPESS